MLACYCCARKEIKKWLWLYSPRKKTKIFYPERNIKMERKAKVRRFFFDRCCWMIVNNFPVTLVWFWAHVTCVRIAFTLYFIAILNSAPELFVGIFFLKKDGQIKSFIKNLWTVFFLKMDSVKGEKTLNTLTLWEEKTVISFLTTEPLFVFLMPYLCADKQITYSHKLNWSPILQPFTFQHINPNPTIYKCFHRI